MIYRLFCRALVTVTAVSFSILVAAEEPVDVVNAFHDALNTAMKSETFDKRMLVVGPAVDRCFQTQTIARISLGRNWRDLPEQAQTGYLALLQELIKTTYAARFDNADGQLFSIDSTEPIGENRVRVKSVLKTKSEEVNLDYQLQQQAGRWLIYDVVANGVSDLSLKRSNYASLFSRGGLAAVEAEIRDHIARNMTQAVTPDVEQNTIKAPTNERASSEE